MTAPAKRLATYADIEALPEHVTGEILNGELFVQPRPASPHAIAGTILSADLAGPFMLGRGGPGGWVLLAEPELHLGEHVIVPDIAGWRRARMPTIPDAAAFTLAPDWVCEVLSPVSTATRDREVKMPIYARQGVAFVWLVNPAVQSLEAYRLDEGRWACLGVWDDADVVRAAPFEAVELSLAELWTR